MVQKSDIMGGCEFHEERTILRHKPFFSNAFSTSWLSLMLTLHSQM